VTHAADAQTGVRCPNWGCGGSLHLAPACPCIRSAWCWSGWWYFRKRRLDLIATGNALAKRLRAGDLSGAKRDMEELHAVEAEILRDALDYYADGPDSLQEIVQKGVRQRRKVFESGLLFLGTLGNNAPFVGLFGTVLGVVAAFKELGAASANMAAAGGTGGMGNVIAVSPKRSSPRRSVSWWPFPPSSRSTSSKRRAMILRRTRPLWPIRSWLSLKSTKNPKNSLKTSDNTPPLEDLANSEGRCARPR